MVSRKLKINNTNARYAVGVCLAAIIALGGGLAPLHAQSVRKLPQSLLPAPGNVGISLSLLGVHKGRGVVTAVQHPLFETSWTGRTDEIVAKSSYGNVSSRDLYLWMLLRESPNKPYLFELLKRTKLPEDRKKLAEGLRVEVDEYIFTNLIIPRLMSSVPPDSIYDLKRHIYTLPAWQTVFLQKVVQPSVNITQDDRVKYLQEHTATILKPQRLRTRYIFMNSPETSPASDQDSVEVTMDEMRADILRGNVSFSAAAREHSEAPSASNSGEIPPFGHGELFFQFENAASTLEPGGISPVFRGPRGFYMVQLIQVIEAEKPNLSDPEQAKLVEEGLSRQVLKAAYDIYMRDMLAERRRIKEKTFAWDSLEDNEMLGKVCNFQITKGEFRNAWPGVEDNDLKLRSDIIAPELRTILEREAMVQEVNDLGYGNDPLLQRARWMAANIIRRDAWVDQIRASLPISEKLVYDFWKHNSELFTPLALKRVIKLTMTPSNTVPLPTQTRMQMDQMLASATGNKDLYTVTKRKVQEEESNGLVYDTPKRTKEAFDMLTAPPKEPNFYLNDFTDNAALQNKLEEEPTPDAVWPDESEPTTLDNVSPIETDMTTDTLAPLVDQPTTAPVTDTETTHPEGGAAPVPPSGGHGPVGIKLEVQEPTPPPVTPGPVSTPDPAAVVKSLDNITPVNPADTLLPQTANTASDSTNVYGNEQQPVGPPIMVNDHSPVILPADTPHAGPLPTGRSAPVLGPGLKAEPTPNIRHQLPPPPTSNFPYNPDWFYKRMSVSELAGKVKLYSSSDWLLTMSDLGFIYTPDIADAPRKLDQMPVGAFSRPIVVGRNAVSWYVEEARTVKKQPFEEVKTHVYDIFRSTQIDKTVSNTYNSELKKADVDYKF